jgi:protein-S-isoprenylcysteine O-methyltransferase Ste14
MIDIDPYLLVRAMSLYVPIILTACAFAIVRPNRRQVIGGFLAMAWNLPAILALDVIAMNAGWWRFDASGGLLLGMPVDLWLAWAVLWGPAAAIAFRTTPLFVVCLIALAIDLVLMPAAFPVVRLGSNWLIGECVGLAVCLLPAQLLARWTAAGAFLNGRAFLQAIAFGGVALWVLPAIAIDASGTAWRHPWSLSPWLAGLVVQMLSIPAIVGLSAVQEFATRGGGTPVPFDPPTRIVTSGIYAYVANPMQVSATVMLLALGVVVANLWVALAGVMACVYSIGIAYWDEHQDLRARFGDAWPAYRGAVRHWIPRLRPWYGDGSPVAVLYVSEECGMCSEVGYWYRSRGVRGLSIVAAEKHPLGGLDRITYESLDGSYRVTGTDAVARALEHIHIGWAFLGCLIRLPIVSPLIQLIVDACGGGPRRVRDRLIQSSP